MVVDVLESLLLLLNLLKIKNNSYSHWIHFTNRRILSLTNSNINIIIHISAMTKTVGYASTQERAGMVGAGASRVQLNITSKHPAERSNACRYAVRVENRRGTDAIYGRRAASTKPGRISHRYRGRICWYVVMNKVELILPLSQLRQGLFSA